MAKRIKNTKIGDIFAVPINDKEKRYIQYIISDMAQLNSDVIRAFKKIYPLDANPELSEIVRDDVEFYAHCVTKAGIKRGLWVNIGNYPEVGEFDHIIFRGNNDFHDPNTWYIFQINGDKKYVGKLTEETRKAELELVFTPEDIVDRLKTGKYSGFWGTI